MTTETPRTGSIGGGRPLGTHAKHYGGQRGNALSFKRCQRTLWENRREAESLRSEPFPPLFLLYIYLKTSNKGKKKEIMKNPWACLTPLPSLWSCQDSTYSETFSSKISGVHFKQYFDSICLTASSPCLLKVWGGNKSWHILDWENTRHVAKGKQQVLLDRDK